MTKQQQARQDMKERAQTGLVAAVNNSALEKIKNVQQTLEMSKERLSKAILSNIPVEHIISVGLTLLRAKPELLACDSVSIVAGMFQAAQLGLSLDPILQHAALIPRRGEGGALHAQFMPMYRGLIALARRHPDVVNVDAHIVREQDKFRMVHGTTEEVVHEPAFNVPPKLNNIVGVYAIVKLKGGETKTEFMHLSEVYSIRDRYSKAGDKGPWATDEAEMIRKTAIHRLAKYLDLSPEFSRAVYLDQLALTGVDQHLQITDAGVSHDTLPGDSKRKTATYLPPSPPPEKQPEMQPAKAVAEAPATPFDPVRPEAIQPYKLAIKQAVTKAQLVLVQKAAKNALSAGQITTAEIGALQEMIEEREVEMDGKSRT